MNKLMLSCEKATTLIEMKSVDGLSFSLNLQLKMHTAMCGACRQYQHQSVFINNAIKKHLSDTDSHIGENNLHLETTTKQRITAEIEKNL